MDRNRLVREHRAVVKLGRRLTDGQFPDAGTLIRVALTGEVSLSIADYEVLLSQVKWAESELRCREEALIRHALGAGLSWAQVGVALGYGGRLVGHAAIRRWRRVAGEYMLPQVRTRS
jgi:hypothetical protein